ncbi:isoleucine--tRNA ligase [Rubeoparvulum massiliense]|uniref:isoleucine--tRNA ligase n=1 Tax=Rubeoparvulum massiliense TaxID=1631346 RepID=UPI00065E9669|nr:isoleucine--tRNA ligase [Rubeoparvulum massiliense]
MDYSKTLCLPQTAFPMRGNLPQNEPKTQQRWDEEKIYEKVQARTKGRPTFVLHDGPPYANGDLHMGHALNKVLKDFIVRYKSMSGYDAPYIPGWDTHGLPIEHAVETKEKVNRKSMDLIEFREKCTQYALRYVDHQRGQCKRLSVRGDWDHPYITLKPEYEAWQIRVFGEMAKNGYIYKGMKPVYWSPSSESALAEAEIEYYDKRSPSIYVRFQVTDGQDKLPNGSYVIIWTTTPWTIPANLGIAIHPELDYVLVKVAGEEYLVAEGLLSNVSQALEWSSPEIAKRFKGAELEGVITQHPFYERKSPVVLGEHVTLDTGTGCVHTAPGHGEDDYLVGKKYDLGILSPLDDRGYFTAEAPGFTGMFYEDGNKAVTQLLEEKGALLKLAFINHQYPHDWRTKKPVIYRATEQWFASIDAFRDKMLEQIASIRWTPAWGETRLHNMIRDRGDWCISRQRAWGVPIPVFYCKECGHPLINDQTIEHISKLFGEHGSSVWFAKSEEELLPEGMTCEACGHDHFRKEKDIMDVWFDSGSSHAAVLKERGLPWPADMYLEGSDQYRGWFNSSLITATAVFGRAPYKSILSHGFVLDGEGRKMSKSLGNVVDPVKVSEQLGVDILRLWVSSVDYTADVRISNDILKQIAESYRKIRNTFRFLLGNLSDFDPATDRLPYAEMNELDRYMLSRMQSVLKKVLNAYEEYNFSTVYQTLHHFLTVDLSAFYMDVSKDRLYCDLSKGTRRRSTQTAMYEMLQVLVRLLAPILPHTMEEVWQYIPGQTVESVQLVDMPEVHSEYVDQDLEDKWGQLIALRDEVLKALEVARKDKQIGSSLEADVHLYPDEATLKVLGLTDELEQLFIVSQVHVHEGEAVPADAMTLDGVAVKVENAQGEKCERCWMVLPEVGHDPHHADLCPRCAHVMEEEDHHIVQ